MARAHADWVGTPRASVLDAHELPREGLDENVSPHDGRAPLSVEQIAKDLVQANYAIAFTGAGISTESGLPDYRGATGLWNNKRFEELAHMRTFKRDPEEFWSFYSHRIESLEGIHPNAAHSWLHQLYRQGQIKAVITQNVDGLHREAQWESDTVIELHGTLKKAVCLNCHREYDTASVTWKLKLPVPHCECGEVLKPGVTLFGEEMPRAALDQAMYHAGKADYALVLGSSLRVTPAAHIPEMVLDRGGKVGIINQGGTAFDGRAGVTKVDGALGKTLGTLYYLANPKPKIGPGEVGFLRAQGDMIGEAIDLALGHLRDGDLDKTAWRLSEVGDRQRMLKQMLGSYDTEGRL